LKGVLKVKEIIQTGLTKNYVGYWSERQALKEAAQNICYGGVKSNRKPSLYYLNGYGFMEDCYNGFEKRYLYLGESEQRDDEEGLGNFGEGWKMFLLIMARNNRKHIVETVNFSFYGEMVKTAHGVEVLNIVILSNNRKNGTLVKVECEEDDFNAAIQAFAFLQGIEVEDNKVIANRKGELWINGVRIETDENKNPANLYFAYNLRGEGLTNRDRTQVNQEEILKILPKIIYMADEDFIDNYLRKALDDPENMDFNRAPSFYHYNKDASERWIKGILKIHGASKKEELLISSGYMELDNEAVYRGYKIIELPKNWNWNLSILGFKEVKDVITAKFNVEEIELTEEMIKMLKRAKHDAKKAFALRSINDLPVIKVVNEIIGNDGVTTAYGYYDKENTEIILSKVVFNSQRDLTLVLIHEGVHWKTGADDNTVAFTKGFEAAIGNLLGY
jgi:hypothetical protein